MDSLFSVAVSAVCSAIIALIGWTVLFRNAKKLSSRAETNAIVSSCIGIFKDINDLSEEFWLDKKYNKSPFKYDSTVGIKIKNVQNLFSVLASRNIELTDGSKAIIPIRQACTLKSHKVGSLTDSQKARELQNINNEIIKCEKEIYAAFECKYPPS